VRKNLPGSDPKAGQAEEAVTDEGNVPGRPAASILLVLALSIGAVLLLLHLLR
jgi:hypothetical protein